jgi:3D (Asp-Asp-Asp) domain-containing protein
MDLRRPLVPLALALLALPAWLAEPPATAQQAAWRQLRLAAVGPSRPMRPGATVALRRRVLLPAGQSRVPDKSLYRDQQRLIAPGRDGVLWHLRPLQVGPDGLVRTLPSRTELRRPARAARVAVGTLPVHYLVRNGITYRYMRRLRLVATAYNASFAQNGPWGATAALGGVPLVRGMAAVDPRVIALGTRLYVDGYGPALAADTGSAIVGHRIDLFFDRSAQNTASFGIKTLDVYVLGPQTA